jgi:hypothetical protein
MSAPLWLGLIAVSLLVAGLSLPAQAQQSTSSSFSMGDYGAPRRRATPPPVDNSADPSGISIRGDRWPWLESGATVCATEDDLLLYRAAIAARLDGQPSQPTAANCRRLTRRTPIDIAERRGPADLEIHLNNDAKQLAWTDSWVPLQRPK